MFYSISTFFLFLASMVGVAFFCSRGTKRIQMMGAYAIAFMIAIFYGFRDISVGPDTAEYVRRYQEGVITEDYIFSSVGVAMNNLGFSSELYLLVVAAITSFLLLRSLKNLTGDYAKSAFFLVLMASLPYGIMSYVNIIRQGVAVALILYGISLLYLNYYRRGWVMFIITLFVHKTTALLSLMSYVLNKIWEFKDRKVSLIAYIIIIMVAASLPQIIAFVSPDLESKYLMYRDVDSSESPYLIYWKVVWGILHLTILSILDKRKKIFRPLYAYVFITVLLAIASISNPLISSRFLVSLDLILPVVYASYTGARGRLYIGAIGIMIIYAVVSPFIFNMYNTFLTN